MRTTMRCTRGRVLLAAALLLWARPAAAQQANDVAYTAKIREFTTEPFFLTPLVDQLPASATVPSPLTVLGHIAGAPNVLSYPEQVNDYMRAVAAASPRVKVFSMGLSEEGREMILVAVADEQTIANLDEYRARLGALADPRRTPPEQAERLIPQTKPIYWATGAIHSPETGSPEMLMELVYRLAVEESDHIRAIRDNIIVFITPIVEVDGRAKQVDVHMARRTDPTVNVPTNLVYWGRYAAHDNNRDGIAMGLKLSQHITRTFLEWNPTVMHDLHESASYLYTSTGRGPYNAWIDPILVSEWYRLAHKEVQDMAAYGVPGVYTFDFYDGWGVNYMMWVSNSRNSLGRFYETQGARDASNYIVTANVDRQWHRPSTPLREVVWSIRNNVNLQQSAILIAMREVADNKDYYLENFYLKSQRSVAKARNEGPAAYVFPADDARPGQQARLLQLLQQHGIELHRLTAPTAAGRDTLPVNSYVARLDQPFSRILDMLLDRQYYNPDDPAPYDDVGWTLGPLFNTRTVRVEDVAILDAPMAPVTAPVRAAGGVSGIANAAFYLIDYNADARLTSFRFAHRGLRMDAAEAAFTADSVPFRGGSFIVPASGNPRNLRQLLAEAGRDYGFTAVGVAAAPEVARHAVAAPRIAVMHTWQSTQNEGWLRLGLDEYGVPYDYISVHDVRDNARLREQYDVILFGPSSADARTVVRGLTGPRPLPWQKTALTPNLGAPDETADMRGGLELTGVLNLQNFIKQGGTFVTLTSSSSLPIHFDFTPGVTVRETPNLWARGGVFRTRATDRGSPLLYGYDDEVGVYFNTGPVFNVAGAGGGGGGGGFNVAQGAPTAGAAGSTTARRSGRGGIGEPDIVQGRARDLGQQNVEEFRRQQEQQRQDSATAPQQQAAPSSARIILRFNPQVDGLLISGGLRNGQELANAPALIHASLDSGSVVMFSFNPFWRHHTHGTYAMLFNALLHHGNLHVGREGAPRATTNER
ncbi:MAG TPA: M14 family zinc carboxypeptidase [Longimicrobiales bacterium]|nr:M14 family zinc carboxypeptidase [Longimicrobiales bacterium]